MYNILSVDGRGATQALIAHGYTPKKHTKLLKPSFSMYLNLLIHLVVHISVVSMKLKLRYRIYIKNMFL
jgi:hypothetical protein